MATHGNPMDQNKRRLRGPRKEAYKSEKRGDYGRGTAEFLAGIQINSASSVRGKIPGCSVDGQKSENGARSDAAEENFAWQEEAQSEESQVKDQVMGPSSAVAYDERC
ncbi:hypothetical protein ACTXT7_000322 [Hymenolepis weldensis]